MSENNCNTFILNNCLTAVSAATQNGNILATDGIECKIHIFDGCGHFCGCEKTERPYRRLRYDTQSNSFSALCGCNRAALYCIDCGFNENGVIELDTSDEHRCSCRCGCDCDDFSEPTDASITRIGGEPFFIGAFSKSAHLFDSNGRRLTRLCKADRDELLTDFIAFGEEKYAMSTLKNGIRTISVSENGVTKSAVLNRALSLKMLFAENGIVYGLFGKKYIYNRIMPIYADGTLNLPDTIENCFCSC